VTARDLDDRGERLEVVLVRKRNVVPGVRHGLISLAAPAT